MRRKRRLEIVTAVVAQAEIQGEAAGVPGADANHVVGGDVRCAVAGSRDLHQAGWRGRIPEAESAAGEDVPAAQGDGVDRPERHRVP